MAPPPPPASHGRPVHPDRRDGRGGCHKAFHERIFASILGGLFAEGLLGDGDVLDAGANTGVLSCYLATLDAHRLVHAVEPLSANVAHVRSRYGGLANLRVYHAALGEEDAATVDVRASAQDVVGAQARGLLPAVGPAADATAAADARRASPASPARDARLVPVRSIDALFARRRVALVALDVEGSEAAALRGATAALRRDAPLVAVELFLRRRDETATLALLASLSYRCAIVDEVCGGFQDDCRNALCFPASRLPRFYESHTLDLAAAAGRLRAVNSTSARALGQALAARPARFEVPRVLRMYGEASPNFEEVLADRPRGAAQRMVWAHELSVS